MIIKKVKILLFVQENVNLEIYKANQAVFETFYNRKFMFVCYAFRETEKVITFLADKNIFYIEKKL